MRGDDKTTQSHGIGGGRAARLGQPAPSSTEKKAGHPAGLVRSFSGARGAQVRFLASVPDDVRKLYGSDWFLDREPIVVEAATRLVSDERMRAPWEKLGRNFNATGGYLNDPTQWGGTFAGAAVNAYQSAVTADSWDRLTQREQDIWQSKMWKLVEEFEALTAAAPLPPRGLPVTIPVLEAFVGSLGLDVATKWPPGFDEEKTASGRRARGMPITRVEIIWASEESPWNLIAAMKHYRKQMQSCVTDQPLKKPRDAKAPRARFIVQLTERCQCYFDQAMQELVATSAAVMFGDESINVRLVRRLTVGK